jgi:Tat protein translocase TatC
VAGAGAEMPFLDHLEELRVRLLRVLAAIVIGFGVGYWAVQHFQAVNLLKAPIAPFLLVTGGKLVITSPTEAVMITLKLALVVGLVLVSPYLIFQVWGFLSPALYDREKRLIVPALMAGSLMFIVGALFGFYFLLPQSLPILFSFQSEGLENLITFSEYFGFVVQLCLAMGLAFEIPLLIMLLTALGIVEPARLNRFRRFAIVLAAIGGAVLSPGTDLLSMILMTIPILLLYEIGFFGSWVIHRRQLRRAARSAAALLLLLLGASGVAAQQPVKPGLPRPAAAVRADSLRADSLRTDSTRRRPSQALDTADARRLGLPTAPRHPFAPDDSVMSELLARRGYRATRFRSDSAIVFAEERRIFLRGEAGTRRDLTTLEADSIVYQESDCLIHATGDPALFDKESVLTGFGGIRYNTCIRRGVVTDALTSFKQGSTDWFLRGNLAQDSSASRLYASEGKITSCDLPVPHYHFSAREVKWISKTVMVARPAVLYVRDVPILWLPFVFQDARSGRRSGILIPRFGLNDIVRQDPGYNRQITNIGYYWAPNEYFDVTAKLDWYSSRYVQYGGAVQYRWLNRFLSGAIDYSRLAESTGLRSTNIRWEHRQNFDLSTSLNVSLNYSTSGFVAQRNAIDPALSTQQIVSAANFSKRFTWGTLSLGGNRRQNLSDNSVSLQLPSLAISPKPIDLGPNVTWSPGLTVTNSYESNFPLSPAAVEVAGGALDTLNSTRDTRTTTIGFDTPLRFGGFNWRNSFGYTDTKTDGRTVVGGGVKVPDPTTPDPTDSITVLQVSTGDFSSQINWETGINLPTLFRSTWKLQPSLGIANSTPGPFVVRNRNTNGRWVAQGKRYSLGLTASPTFFAFFPGFGPIARIRHSISPVITWSYSPAAAISADYARAVALPGQAPQLHSVATQQLSLGLSQNFEGKSRRSADDTSSVENVRRFRILGIQTSPIQYDFEQAKLPGRTGWRTQSLTNQFQSDLVPGFNLSLTHDLWKGTVGTDTARFSPFLQAVTASFAISGGTVQSILGLFGIGRHRDTTAASAASVPTSYVASQSRFGRPPSFFGQGSEQTLGLSTNRRFSANFNYSLSRQRPAASSAPAQQSLGFSTSFAPTPFWTVSWSSQYNITQNKFESQVVRLERVLHEWRAGFNFVRNPNGNFAFYFSVYLSDLPDIKFDYNQTSIEQ